MSFFSFWFLMTIATTVIAGLKNRNILGWFFLGLFTGPLGLLLILLLSKAPGSGRTFRSSGQITSDTSLTTLQREIKDAQARLRALSETFTQLEAKLNSVVTPGAVDAGTSIPARACEPVVNASVPLPEEGGKRDLESNIGKFWLNKIGVVILAFGIAFLIAQAFTHFGPFAKIACAYLAAAALFAIGVRLEKKERFINYARVLLGGGWAITYVTTYTMYHFEAARIITSQALELFLLALVACGIILHSLKYKSETLCAIALGVGYITASIGTISYFTFLSSLILAMAAIYLVHRMQWVKIIFLGVIFTYAVHFFWITRQINIALTWDAVIGGSFFTHQAKFFLNSLFLWLYWILFTAAIHLIKKDKQPVYAKLPAANFCNFLLLFILFFPQLAVHYPGYKFYFTLGFSGLYFLLALLSTRKGDRLLCNSNLIAAVGLLTFAIPLKFIPFHTSLIWMVELPFLLLAGILFERRVLRYLSLSLACVLLFKFIGVDISLTEKISFFGTVLTYRTFVSILGVISFSACYAMLYRIRLARSLDPIEAPLRSVYSGLVLVYLTFFLCWVVPVRFITLSIVLETMLALAVSRLLGDTHVRVFSLFLFLFAAMRFCFIDSLQATKPVLRWVKVSLELLCLYAYYGAYRLIIRKNPTEEHEKYIINFCFGIITFLLLFAIYRYIPHFWTSLFLGLAGGVLVSAGFLTHDKVFRIGGFIVFGITLFRVVVVDLASLSTLYKITSFVALGILFLAVSFIYTRYNLNQPQDKK